MVLTKCVEPPTRHSQEVVYDFEFIEDYVRPQPEEQHQQLCEPEAQSFQFSRLSTPPSSGTASGGSQSSLQRHHQKRRGRQDGGRRNLIDPSDYTGLEHPLTLMVCMCRLIGMHVVKHDRIPINPPFKELGGRGQMHMPHNVYWGPPSQY